MWTRELCGMGNFPTTDLSWRKVVTIIIAILNSRTNLPSIPKSVESEISLKSERVEHHVIVQRIG